MSKTRRQMYLLAGSLVLFAVNNGVQATTSDSSASQELVVKADAVTAKSGDAAKAVDGILADESRWAAQGKGQWLQLRFAQAETINGVAIKFYKGDKRVATFSVATSLDGKTWTTQLNMVKSSGKASGFERFTFPAVSAKYVRIIGYANTENNWISIIETYAFGTTASGTGTGSDTGSTTGSGTDTGVLRPDQPPSGNFNLSGWKLTLPVSQVYYFGSGSSSAAEIMPGQGNNKPGILPLDAGFHDMEYFFTAADGSMAFKTPLSGGASTANSSYVRSELRELYRWTPGMSSADANWPNEGSHTLSAKVKVVDFWPTDPQTIVGQIHAKDSDKALIKLQWDGPTAAVRAIINKDPSSGNPFSLSFPVVGLNEFSYTIALVDNKLTVTVNGVSQSVTFGVNGMSTAWNNHVYYFKAGNYAQADRESGGVFEVHISALKVEHK